MLRDVCQGLTERQDYRIEVANLFSLAARVHPIDDVPPIASPFHPCFTTICNHVLLRMSSRSDGICLLVLRLLALYGYSNPMMPKPPLTNLVAKKAIWKSASMPFLGKFEVPERVKVAVLSGESGQVTIRETALRVAQFKGVKLSACEVLWGFDLPRLGVEEDLLALSAGLRDNGVGVVFIDPAYLCLYFPGFPYSSP